MSRIIPFASITQEAKVVTRDRALQGSPAEVQKGSVHEQCNTLTSLHAVYSAQGHASVRNDFNLAIASLKTVDKIIIGYCFCIAIQTIVLMCTASSRLFSKLLFDFILLLHSIKEPAVLSWGGEQKICTLSHWAVAAEDEFLVAVLLAYLVASAYSPINHCPSNGICYGRCRWSSAECTPLLLPMCSSVSRT